MPQSDPAFYERAIRRIRRLILVLGLCGTAFVIIRFNVPTGIAFSIGAAASYLSFWNWQHIAAALSADKKPSSRFFSLRLIAFIVLAYVIMKLLGLSVAAAVAGTLVCAAAILLEIIYELTYART